MISISVFVVACVIFLAIMVVEYIRYWRLSEEYKAVAHFLDLYINKYGAISFVVEEGDDDSGE